MARTVATIPATEVTPIRLLVLCLQQMALLPFTMSVPAVLTLGRPLVATLCVLVAPL